MAVPMRRTTIRRRRATALLAAVVATAGIWALFLREGSGDEAAREARAAGISAPVEGLAGRMTPEQLVDQVLLLGFSGTDAGSPVMSMLATRQIGGVFVAGSNWQDPSQGAGLVAQLRAAGLAGGRIPPLIAVRQEGGPARAFPDLPPSASEFRVGNTGSTRGAQAWSAEAGAALRSLGFDLNLFPVADVATAVSPLGDRAFSGDAALTAQLTAASMRGCDEAGLACAAAHFPGLGAASQDTDEGPATVSLDAASLDDRDLAAFRAAFAEHAPAVVLSLAFYAAYDPVTPGALSPEVATELLRDRLRYAGLAITDDLGAGAVGSAYSVPAAAVAAIAAGADMLQIVSPADQVGVRDALLRALASGELPKERLQQAAGRVLELKRSVGLLKGAL